MKKIFLILLALMLAVSISMTMAGCGGGTPSEQEEEEEEEEFPLGVPVITFGGQDISSGRYGDYGRMTRMGAELAAEEINAAGGILNSEVEILFMDTMFNPDVAVANALAMKEEGADFYFGMSADAASVAVAAYLEELDSILITCHSSTDMTREYATQEERLFVGPVGMDLDAILPVMYLWGETGLDLGSWFHIACDYDYGYNINALLQASTEKYAPDAEYLGWSLVPYGAADFTPYIAAAMEAQPAVIFADPWGGDGAMLIRQAQQMGLFDQEWFKAWFQCMGGSIDIAEAITDDAMVGAFNGKLYATARYIWNQNDDPENVAFVEAFRERYAGRYPNYSAMHAYATVYTIKRALESVGSLDMMAIIDYLETETHHGPMGEYTFREYDHQSQYTVPAGRYTYDADVADIAFLTDFSTFTWQDFQRQPPDYEIP